MKIHRLTYRRCNFRLLGVLHTLSRCILRGSLHAPWTRSITSKRTRTSRSVLSIESSLTWGKAGQFSVAVRMVAPLYLNKEIIG